MRTTCLVFAACCAGALLAFPFCAARAEKALARLDALPSGAPAELGEPPPAAPEYRFKGRGLYLGAGPGIVADLGEPSFNMAVYLTLPITSWMGFEGASSLTHLATTTHHDEREQTTALGIGLGLRFTPFELGLLRPYLAARVAHIHFWPDPWGAHGKGGDETADHASMHRWGAGIGAGLDAPISATLQRWRIGFDLEALALSGPKANALLHTALTLGLGL